MGPQKQPQEGGRVMEQERPGRSRGPGSRRDQGTRGPQGGAKRKPQHVTVKDCGAAETTRIDAGAGHTLDTDSLGLDTVASGVDDKLALVVANVVKRLYWQLGCS